MFILLSNAAFCYYYYFFCIVVNDIMFCFVIYPSIAVLNIHLKQCTRLLIGNENLQSETIDAKNGPLKLLLK